MEVSSVARRGTAGPRELSDEALRPLSETKGKATPLLLLLFFCGWATFAFTIIDVGRFSITLFVLISCVYGISVTRIPVTTLMVAALLLLSTLLAWSISFVEYPNSDRTYTHLVQSLLAIGVLFGTSSMNWRRRLPTLQKTLTVVGSLVVAYGLYQVLARMFALPFAFLPITNLQLSSDYGLQRGYGSAFLGLGSFTRASSLFPEPSDLGRFTLWLFAVGAACKVRRSRLILMALGGGGLIVSQSLGALLALGFFLAMLLLVRRRPSEFVKAALAATVFLALFAVLFPDNMRAIADRLLSLLFERENYLKETTRFVSVDTCLEVFKQAPFLGHGIASMKLVTPPDTVVSSTILFNLIERGLVGSALYYGPFAWMLLALSRSKYRNDEAAQTAVNLLICEAFFFGTFAMTYFPPIYFALGMAAACVPSPLHRRIRKLVNRDCGDAQVSYTA